jgi:hypothetical protein
MEMHYIMIMRENSFSVRKERERGTLHELSLRTEPTNSSHHLLLLLIKHN